jgi:hypothetical protein
LVISENLGLIDATATLDRLSLFRLLQDLLHVRYRYPTAHHCPVSVFGDLVLIDISAWHTLTLQKGASSL